MMKRRFSNRDEGTELLIPDRRRAWRVCWILGGILWIVGLSLWAQGSLDKAVLFAFNPQRIAMDPIIVVSQWLSSYGMAAITFILVIDLLLVKLIPALNTSPLVFFYTICSFGLSGIAGDLLKEVFARPRPAVVYGREILALSQSLTPALPSGHATKSMALVLPFIVIVSHTDDLNKVIKPIIGLIACGICFSRIALGAHYLSDVLTGVGMAFVGLPLSMMFANMLLHRMKQEQLSRLVYLWGLILILLTWAFMIL